MEKSEKILTWVSTCAIVAYAVVSAFTLSEIKKSNELTMGYQKVSMRPWVFVTELTTHFINEGKPNELWEMTMPLINPTDQIAMKVRMYMYQDDKEEILTNRIPESGIVGVVPPHSTTQTMVSCTVTKAQVIRATEEKSQIFIHGVVWYEQENGAKHESRYTYKMSNYKENIEVVWQLMTPDLR